MGGEVMVDLAKGLVDWRDMGVMTGEETELKDEFDIPVCWVIIDDRKGLVGCGCNCDWPVGILLNPWVEFWKEAGESWGIEESELWKDGCWDV